jgi:hypothetical protein
MGARAPLQSVRAPGSRREAPGPTLPVPARALLAFFVLAVVSTGFLVFNMVGTLTYKQQIFFDQETISGVELVILLGFGLVLLFDVTSLLCSWLKLRRSEGLKLGDVATLALGVLCPFLLFADKVMVDEIAREYRLGWEVLGEWIILYVLLTTQLVYNLIMLWKLLRSTSRGHRPALSWSSETVQADHTPGS